MIATPHILAGAAIARTAGKPWLAWPAAFASHFLLDYIPHLDSHALYGVPQGGPTGPEAAVAVADFVLGAALVTWLVWRRADRRLVLVGALLGIAIDLVDNVPALGPWLRVWPGTAWLGAWHHGIQHNVTPAQWPLGVGTQVAVVAIALVVIKRLEPRDTRPSQEG